MYETDNLFPGDYCPAIVNTMKKQSFKFLLATFSVTALMSLAIGTAHSLNCSDLGSLAQYDPNCSATTSTNDTDQLLRNAFENQRSNLQVEGKGKVIKILPDDLDGNRHQRFIVRLSSGQTLLIAHNIDLAPRINSLREGDPIMFYGEYEWSSQGGIIHWTHHDPTGRHIGGWLKHNGKIYQ